MVILQFFGLSENESQKQKKTSVWVVRKLNKKPSTQNLGVLLDEHLLLKPTLTL